jgi:hypothetical protein
MMIAPALDRSCNAVVAGCALCLSTLCINTPYNLSTPCAWHVPVFFPRQYAYTHARRRDPHRITKMLWMQQRCFGCNSNASVTTHRDSDTATHKTIAVHAQHFLCVWSHGLCCDPHANTNNGESHPTPDPHPPELHCTSACAHPSATSHICNVGSCLQSI